MKNMLHMCREFQLKQGDSTTRLLQYAKFTILTAPNSDEHVEQKEISFLASGIEKWHSYFGRQFDGFLNTKYTFTI